MNNANYVFVYTQYTFQLCLFHFKEGIMKVLIIAIFQSIFKFVKKKKKCGPQCPNQQYS